ncbi:MAG: hypothetical protein LBV22_02180 [Mycoplasmataceae bacterium]|nr:hypothetical protein [Mycoplasmataceae bacterium]
MDTPKITSDIISPTNIPKTKIKNPMIPKNVHTYSRLDILYVKVSLRDFQVIMLD